MIKLIIFDLDDTLVGKADDSVDLIAMRRKDVVNTLRLDSTSAEEKITLLRKEGLDNYSLYERLRLSNGRLIGGNLLRNNILNSFLPHQTPNSDLASYLKHLNASGSILTIVTNSPTELVKPKLDSARIPIGIFEKIIGWEIDQQPPKTGRDTKEVFSSLLREYGAEPEEAVSVGDEVKIDLKPIKEMGGWTIMVGGDKYRTPDDLKYVDTSIESINMLGSAIESISRKLKNRQ